ncbi:putative sodium-coupled neutral amino acid transporter 6 [Glandiceps talaboti]
MVMMNNWERVVRSMPIWGERDTHISRQTACGSSRSVSHGMVHRQAHPNSFLKVGRDRCRLCRSKKILSEASIQWYPGTCCCIDCHWVKDDNTSEKDMFRADSDEEVSDNETEQELKWRRERYEREQWLEQQQKEKEGELLDINEDSQFTKIIRNIQKKEKGTPKELTQPAPQVKPTIKEKGVSTPKPLHKTMFRRGSFLCRSKEDLAKIAALTKPVANPNGPKNSRNFVFKSVTPPKENFNKKPQVRRSISVTGSSQNVPNSKRPRLDRSQSVTSNKSSAIEKVGAKHKLILFDPKGSTDDIVDIATDLDAEHLSVDSWGCRHAGGGGGGGGGGSLVMLKRNPSDVEAKWDVRIEPSGIGNQEGPTRKGSFWISVFNLTSLILGSGMLGVPYAMMGSGIILFSILLVIVALLGTYSNHLLLKSCDLVNVKTYEDIGSRALGLPGRLLVICAILLQTIGATASYLFISKNELPAIIRTLADAGADANDWYLNGTYLLLLMMIVIIAPLAFLPNIGFLGYTSGFKFFFVMFFIIVIVVKKFSFPCPIPTTDWENITETNIAAFLIQNTTDLTTAITSLSTSATTTMSGNSTGDECTPKLFSLSLETAFAVPIIVYSFSCQIAVLPIFYELERPSKDRMQNVVYVSIAASFTIYMFIALFGYLTFYDNVQSDLLKSYMTYNPHDTLMLVARLAVLISFTFTVPLTLFPSRKALTFLIAPDKPFSWIRHTVLTVFLLTLVTILTIAVPDLKDIFGIIGAAVSPTVDFILPAMSYLCIGIEPLISREKIMALCLLIIGVLVSVVSLSAIIAEMVERNKE